MKNEIMPEGKVLYDYDQHVDFVYIITKGVIEENISNHSILLRGVGSMLSSANITNLGNSSFSSAIVKSEVQVTSFPISVIR